MIIFLEQRFFFFFFFFSSSSSSSSSFFAPLVHLQLVARPGQALVQNPPLVSITSQAALLGDGASSSSSFHPQAGARRRITVTVSGPDHMVLHEKRYIHCSMESLSIEEHQLKSKQR